MLMPMIPRFERFVTIEDNDASNTGGAMWVAEAATVDFRKPTKVKMSGNTVPAQVRARRIVEKSQQRCLQRGNEPR